MLPEIARIRPAEAAAGEGEYPVFRPIRRAGDIEPAEQALRRYVRHVWSQRGELKQQEVAHRLGLSVNTLKKYLAEPSPR